jgi:hypothetical protein
MPRALADTLSAMSGLPEAWSPATDSERSLHATRRIEWQGEASWVASVIQPCGVDHTGRPNRIAHHRLLDSGEVRRACPIALLRDRARWLAAWQGAPREMDTPASLPDMHGTAGAARAWAEAYGDAGIAAGALEAALRSGVGAWIVVSQGADRLQLLGELAGLLPRDRRWERGWSTRALKPSAEGAPMICVIDPREPALEAFGHASWVIRAASLEPRADAGLLRLAREGESAPQDGPTANTATGNVAWRPLTRLAVAGRDDSEATTPSDPSGAREGSGPPAVVSPIEITMEAPARGVGARLAWIAAFTAALLGVAWILLRGRSG